jgi:hypothetical protein
MSEKALIYLDEDMRHRFLVIYEASGMAGDMQTYLIRTLLSEGRIRYQTAESTASGVKPRLLEMEGPTGLIVTTTQTRMHAENETRLFSLLVTDSRQQTADILMAMADEDREPVSMDEWRALQTWLEGQNNTVYIPYSKQLAGLIPPVAVRLRRDFMAVLQLIRAHAVLHQAQRKRDAKGRIIASLDDYAVVRELVAELVAEGVDATVSDTVRETVAAVKKLTVDIDKEHVSIRRLADALKLDKSAASRRWQTARDAGYLKNLEDGKGKPAQIALGEPLPENIEILPPVEGVRDRCSVAVETEGRYTPGENTHTSVASASATVVQQSPVSEGDDDNKSTKHHKNTDKTPQKDRIGPPMKAKPQEGGNGSATLQRLPEEGENPAEADATVGSVQRSVQHPEPRSNSLTHGEVEEDDVDPLAEDPEDDLADVFGYVALGTLNAVDWTYLEAVSTHDFSQTLSEWHIEADAYVPQDLKDQATTKLVKLGLVKHNRGDNLYYPTEEGREALKWRSELLPTKDPAWFDDPFDIAPDRAKAYRALDDSGPLDYQDIWAHDVLIEAGPTGLGWEQWFRRWSAVADVDPSTFVDRVGRLVNRGYVGTLPEKRGKWTVYVATAPQILKPEDAGDCE